MGAFGNLIGSHHHTYRNNRLEQSDCGCKIISSRLQTHGIHVGADNGGKILDKHISHQVRAFKADRQYFSHIHNGHGDNRRPDLRKRHMPASFPPSGPCLLYTSRCVEETAPGHIHTIGRRIRLRSASIMLFFQRTEHPSAYQIPFMNLISKKDRKSVV